LIYGTSDATADLLTLSDPLTHKLTHIPTGERSMHIKSVIYTYSHIFPLCRCDMA